MLDDLRHSLRQLRLSPGFAFLAIGTLAVAIGANTTFFSLFHALVLRPLPLEAPDRLVGIITTDGRGQQTGFPVPLVDSFVREQAIFEGVAAYLGGVFATVASPGSTPATSAVDYVSGDYYRTLRITPALGRLIDTSDELLDQPAPAAVLGFRFWQRRFGGDPSVIGRTIELDEAPFTIVGVTPEEFFGLRVEIEADVTVPISALPHVHRGVLAGQLLTAQAAVARLANGVMRDQASARLQTLWPALIDQRLPADTPASRRDALERSSLRVDDLTTGFSYMREPYTLPLQLLVGLTACMILIACVNLAGLLLSRTAARDREFATRLALGASRGALVRQALAEGLLIALVGAACGLPLAWWGARALALLFGADYIIPISIDVRPDRQVLMVTTIVTLVTAAIFTVVPALRIVHRRGSEALGTSRTVARSSTSGAERLLVAQFGLSVVLLVSAAALAQSLAGIRDLDPGFPIDGLYSAGLRARPNWSGELASSTYQRTLLSAARSIPGVESAALTDTRPAGGYVRTMDVAPVGESNAADVSSNLDMVSPEYFATMGIPVLEGREFEWFDDASRDRVAIVSANLASRLFPDGRVLGRRIRAGADPGRQSMEIVGVVGDARIRDVRQREPLNVFVALAQELRATGTPELILRSMHSFPLAQDVQAAVEPLGRHRLWQLRAADDQLNRLLLRERMMSAFAMFFAALAAFLIAIGIYGLLTFAVRVRTREIGIHLAVGASPLSVTAMVLKHGLRLAVIGVVVGLPLALYAGTVLRSYLFDVQANDPLLIAGVATFVLALTLGASYLPATLASRVDPATALRTE